MSDWTEAPAPFVRTGRGIDYVVAVPLVWEVGRVGSGLKVTVPQGRTFDVSVPWALRWIVSPHDPRYLKAAALHDEMLDQLGWSRVTAAAEFHEALRSEDVGRFRRLVMWLAVSLWRWS